MNDIAAKMARWLIFSVIIALVPLVFAFVNAQMKNVQADWTTTLGNGELLIVIAAICAGAVGELFGSSNRFKVSKIVAGGSTVVVLIFSALVFASIEPAGAATVAQKGVIATASIYLFLFAIGCCASCIVLSET